MNPLAEQSSSCIEKSYPLDTHTFGEAIEMAVIAMENALDGRGEIVKVDASRHMVGDRVTVKVIALEEATPE